MIEKGNISQDKIESQAGFVLYKTNMLIQLCDSILPEEEGRKNVHLRFIERIEREKAGVTMTTLHIINKISRVFRNCLNL